MPRPALRSILVASDLSEGSDVVVQAAAGLAELAGAELHVLHALDFHATPYAAADAASPTFQGRFRQAEEALAEQVGRIILPTGTVSSRKMLLYAAHRAIVEEAEAVSADLIVLGPHRQRAHLDGVLGSTADRVVRTAGVPCLVVRGPLRLPLRTVVAPLDLSGPARSALDVALSWSLALGAVERGTGRRAVDVRALHVVPTRFRALDFPFDLEVVGPEVRKEIAAALARAGEPEEVRVREAILWGDEPAGEIVAYAAAEQADLLVLGTHGYGAVGRTLMGSVASRVARRATAPVLLVPPGEGGRGLPLSGTGAVHS